MLRSAPRRGLCVTRVTTMRAFDKAFGRDANDDERAWVWHLFIARACAGLDVVHAEQAEPPAG
jgi:hypothetical protein